METHRRIGAELNRRMHELARILWIRLEKSAFEQRNLLGDIREDSLLHECNFHFSFLAGAIGVCSKPLFQDYLAWESARLKTQGVPGDFLLATMTELTAVVRQSLDPGESDVVTSFINAGIDVITGMSIAPTNWTPEEPQLSLVATRYLDALLKGEHHTATNLILEAADRGATFDEICSQVFQPTLYEVGRRWQLNQLSVDEEHYFAAATQLIMAKLLPPAKSTHKESRVMLAACGSGELHEIGLRMVVDYFRIDGWNAIFQGAITGQERFVKDIIDHKADLVAISVTMAFNVCAVRDLVATIRSNDACKHVRIICGGHPFRVERNLWQTIGADGSAEDASQALSLGNQICKRT